MVEIDHNGVAAKLALLRFASLCVHRFCLLLCFGFETQSGCFLSARTIHYFK